MNPAHPDLEKQTPPSHPPSVVYRLNPSPPYNMTFIEGALETILGLPPENWLTHPQAWKKQIHHEDLPRCLRKLALALQTNNTQEWQHRYTNNKGKTIWVKHRIQPTLSSDQRCTAITGQLQDITSQRPSANTHPPKKTPPKASPSLALNHLAGGIAHHFNNALASILGNAQLLLRDCPPGNPHKPRLLEIIKSGEQAAALTKDLLTFSEKNKQTTHILDLNKLLNAITPQIQKQLTTNQTLITKPSSKPLPINGHHQLLKDTILQLIKNSQNAMPKGGTITLKTNHLPPEKTPLKQPTASLSISDTGCGIPPEKQPYIFDPFYSSHKDPQHRGLALALALHTITQHHGTIETTSATGHGTTMTLHLPLIENTTTPHSPPTP